LSRQGELDASGALSPVMDGNPMLLIVASDSVSIIASTISAREADGNIASANAKPRSQQLHSSFALWSHAESAASE
jgi:hypothetical protein